MSLLTDQQYTSLFSEIEQAGEINDRLLKSLSLLHMECDARCLEAAMGKRSTRSAKGRKMINLVNALEKKFDCRLAYHNGRPGTIEGHYTKHEVGL